VEVEAEAEVEAEVEAGEEAEEDLRSFHHRETPPMRPNPEK
jgi:hypothetical protein